MTTHTPGPWATDILIAADIVRDEGDDALDYAAVYVDHGSGKGSEICAMRHDPSDGLDISDPEHQANARLIAAAPELLAALEASYMAMLGYTHRNEVIERAIESARAAIVKARGI